MAPALTPQPVPPAVATDAAAWHWLTRLGEAQLLLPLMALVLLWLLRRPGQARTALGWLAATALAAAITTASKVAFIGYGWGLPALDFTGFSGHAMFAAAVWPPLLRLAAAAAWPARAAAGWGVVAGYALAAMVAVSRVQVGAHSWSEVGSGLALGALASGAVLAMGCWPRQLRAGLVRAVALALGAGLALGVAAAPASRTHDWVTRLALAASGRGAPFERWMLHRGAVPPAGARGPASSLQLR